MRTGELDEAEILALDEELEALYASVDDVFARPASRENLRERVRGLLSEVPRKNMWQLAEAAGHPNPDRLQGFLAKAAWDADEVRDRVCGTGPAHAGTRPGRRREAAHAVAVRLPGLGGLVLGGGIAIQESRSSGMSGLPAPAGVRRCLDWQRCVGKKSSPDPQNCRSGELGRDPNQSR